MIAFGAVLGTRVIENPRLFLGGLAMLVLLVTALSAGWVAPHDPLDQDLLLQNLPPFWIAGHDPAFLLGTDNLGRDLLSRLIWGARPALIVMGLGASLSCGIGLSVGLLAGYFGGWVDGILSRILEVFLSFPPMLLAIVLAAVIGPGLATVILAITVIGWTHFARVVRGEMLVLREQDFVTAARLLGFGSGRVIASELLPNLLPMVLSLLALEMGRAIIVEAVLAFIGFSASDLSTWGGIIADGRSDIYEAWWVMTLPILCIVGSVLAMSFLADGLRGAFDPVARR